MAITPSMLPALALGSLLFLAVTGYAIYYVAERFYDR